VERKLTIYLDNNATTTVESRVFDVMQEYFLTEYGNAGSRTHEYGLRANQAVGLARNHIARVVACEPEEVIFTSGATESNNLAILGLENYAKNNGKCHIITSAIEHKAVLEPIEVLEQRGFEVTVVPSSSNGVVDVDAIRDSLRDETFLVSIMHANNETGVLQPIEKIATILNSHDAYFHSDAAQTFGKEISPLQNDRIDLISISSHKIYGPKGMGCLVTRKRDYLRPQLTPLMFGGGQEHGLRPGTLPVPLIAGLGEAANLALSDNVDRKRNCLDVRKEATAAFESIGAHFNGDQERCLPHVINVSIPGLNSEAAMIALKGNIAISNGSACTSSTYEPSHVLGAMGLDDELASSALRISWGHLTSFVDWEDVTDVLSKMKT
jgi:cysteine desulfurase